MDLRVVVVVVAACVVSLGCSVEATWTFLKAEYSPVEKGEFGDSALSHPSRCDSVTVVPRKYNVTTGSHPPYEVPLHDGLPINFTEIETYHSEIHYGSLLPDHPWPWFVRVGNSSGGVLVSRTHVLTLVECLGEFERWFGGYYSFSVQILNQRVEVVKVQLQREDEFPFPLALLTLKEHNVQFVTPVCMGYFRQGYLNVAASWEVTEGIPMKFPVLVYPWEACLAKTAFDSLICASPGPIVCGSALIQEDSNLWQLVGLGLNNMKGLGRYVHLGPSLEWLGC